MTIFFLSIMCVLTLVLNCTTAVAYEFSYETLLAPYQEIIEQLNAEFNCSVSIPKEAEAEIYHTLNKKYSSLEEFKCSLRQQLENTKNLNGSDLKISASGCNNMQRIVRDDWLQFVYYDGESLVSLRSKVVSPSGDAGTYRYEEIVDIGAGWQSGTGDFYSVFDYKNATYSVNKSWTECTVKGNYRKQNDDGLILTGIWKLEVTFSSLEQ